MGVGRETNILTDIMYIQTTQLWEDGLEVNTHSGFIEFDISLDKIIKILLFFSVSLE